MTVKAYLGQAFSYTHENQAFNQLYKMLAAHWGSADELVTLIGNVSCNGCELDVLVIKGASITVVDFKNYGGKIEFKENGLWYADGVEVRGGSKSNPFRQIHTNKFALLEWMRTHFDDFDKGNNLGHISGMVLFQKSIVFDQAALPPKLTSWLHIVDFSSSVQRLSEISSPQINISPSLQRQIVQALNVEEYRPADSLGIIEFSADEERHEMQVVWTADQRRASDLTKQLLKSKKPEVLFVSGVVSSGKSRMLEAFLAVCQEHSRDLVPLAPNAGLAGVLNAASSKSFHSIFSHIYSVGSAQESEIDGEKVIIHPMRQCNDSPDAVYLIDEAHLLSDGYFEIGGERYGSGHTISDFIDFSNLGKSERKLIVLSDPYQIKRSGEGTGLQTKEFLESKGLSVQHHNLEQVVDDKSRSHILASSISVAEKIQSGRFSSLDVPADLSEIIKVEDQDKRPILEKMFAGESRMDAVVINAEHRETHRVNDWIRRNIKGFQGRSPQQGDRVELYNYLLEDNSSSVSQDGFVPVGSYGTVLACERQPVEISQQLKGRDIPVVLTFREVVVQFDHRPDVPRRFMYLEPFLLSEKPELDNDMFLALRVNAEVRISEQLRDDREQVKKLKEAAKSSADLKEEYQRRREQLAQKRIGLLLADPYYNAARLRYAYATTCHHAQGRHWDNVLIDSAYGGKERANQGYFRWLYTALTRASHCAYLANFSPISPFDKTIWKRGAAPIRSDVKSLFRLNYDKDRVLTEQDLQRPIPVGFNVADQALLSLYIYLSQVVESLDCRINKVEQFPYQEQYFVTANDGREVVLSLHYNGQYDVSRIAVKSGDAGLGQQLLTGIRGPVQLSDPLAQDIYQSVLALLQAGGFQVEGVIAENWQLRLSVADEHSEKAIIKVYYSKEGKVGTVMPEKATSELLLDELQGLFTSPTQESLG